LSASVRAVNVFVAALSWAQTHHEWFDAATFRATEAGEAVGAEMALTDEATG
jgi:hypothetical protein